MALRSPSGPNESDFQAVTSEIQATRKQQKTHTTAAVETIDSMIQAVAACRTAIGESGNVHTPLETLRTRFDTLKPVDRLTKVQKQFHSSISRLGKCIDKRFGAQSEDVSWDATMDPAALNKMIAAHLYRTGHFASADALVKEAGVEVIAPSTREALEEIFQVVRALKLRDLEPAKRWVGQRSTQLNAMSSTLSFQLARLEFMTLVARVSSAPTLSRRDSAELRAAEEVQAGRSGECVGEAGAPGDGSAGQGSSTEKEQVQEALHFAQTELAAFSESHLKEVMQLMGTLIWAGNLEDSPYAALLSDDLWNTACDTLAKDGCRIAGLPRDSHLSVAFTAGMTALPMLQKMKTVVQSSNLDWNSIDELPVQLDALDQREGFSFHSIFSCPLSREQSSRINPPILLKCGHVICRSSIDRIPKDDAVFKCPTCPMEQDLSETREIVI